MKLDLMRRALLLVACAFVLLLIGWWKVGSAGERAVAASNAALASGDVPAAIAQAKLGAQCRGTRWSNEGFSQLQRIADAAEQRGDVPTMKNALVAMRSAADSIDDADWRARADEGLSRAAIRAEGNPVARLDEGCSPTSDPPCTHALKTELATPTHPTPSTHGMIAIGIGIVLGLALFVTRTRKKAPSKA